MTQIETIRLAGINNMAYFNFMKSVVDRAEANATVAEGASGQLGALKTALDALDEVLNVSLANAATAKIEAADKERDGYYTGYKNAVKALMNAPAGTMRDAAEELWQNIKDYRIDPKEQLDKETGKLANMAADLEGKLKEQVAALGLTTLVGLMKTANETVRTLLIDRDNETSARVVGAVKSARAVTDEAYKALVLQVNALFVVQGGDGYDTFITETNEQIGRYKQRVMKSKAKKTDDSADGSATDTGTGEY